jgi:hypothetical protein
MSPKTASMMHQDGIIESTVLLLMHSYRADIEGCCTDLIQEYCNDHKLRGDEIICLRTEVFKAFTELMKTNGFT